MSSAKRSILITGCTEGGAGHALALEFAAKGLRVFATTRSDKPLASLESKGIEVLSLEVTSADSIASLKGEISKRTGGKLDILFNNAGMLYEAPAVESDPARVRKMFDANVFGVMDMATAFTPLLLGAVRDSRYPPTIINSSSILHRIPFPFSAAYNATKAAVASYSDTLRLELGPLGIKVVTLVMGEVATSLMHPNNISFGEHSLYTSAEKTVQKRSQEHVDKTMRPDEFARKVVNEIVVAKPAAGKGEFIWKGSNATLIWLLHSFGFHKIFDSLMLSGAGLSNKDIKQAIFEKGQRSIKLD